MTDRAMEQSEAVRHLMAMKDEVVSAKYLAPILHMDPSVIVKYAKDGTWNQERNGGFVISGEGPGAHVKFKRVDFLRKWGFLEPEPPERTDSDRLDEIIELIRVQNAMLIEIGAYIKKAASVAAPAD